MDSGHNGQTVSESVIGGFRCTQVGKGGELGKNRFLMANETEFPGVNFLSISTGWGARAVWIFNDDLGGCMMMMVYH